MSEIGNMEKYEKYKKQMERLKKAMVNKFWLEAVFIEYGVMEDRTKVILKLSGRKEKPKEALAKKTNKIKEYVENGKMPLGRYFTAEYLENCLKPWIEKRNDLVHKLMYMSFSDEEVEAIATEGQEIIKTLCSKTTSYRRILERQQKKQEG